MLLGTLRTSLLDDLLTKNFSGKGTVRAGKDYLELVKELKKKLQCHHIL